MKKTILLILGICLTGFLAQGTTFLLNDAAEQMLNAKDNHGTPGFLGKAMTSDENDAKIIKNDDDAPALFCDGIKTFATIPNQQCFDFSKAENAVISIDVKLLPAPAGQFRWQLLTKGADSNANSWQLRYARNFGKKDTILAFFLNVNNKELFTIEGLADLKPYQWYSIKVVADKTEITLYLDGKEIAKTACAYLPQNSGYPLIIGGYAFGEKMRAGGKFKNLTIDKNLQTVNSTDEKKK